MAELAATVLGIAGVASVLQNLLQCYKDFVTARDFPESFTTLMLRAALLENSTRSWAEAVGLMDHSGAPLETFLIECPTEKNVRLAARTLTRIEELMKYANKTLNEYHFGGEPLPPEILKSSFSKDEEKDSRRRKIFQKLSRATRTSPYESSNMVRRRISWSLLDKEDLETTLADVTMLLDRLNNDFKPKSLETQIKVYLSSLQGLGIEAEEMQLIAGVAVDKVSQSVAALAIEGHGTGTTGSTFERIVLDKQAMLHVGDNVAQGFVLEGGGLLPSSKNLFKAIEGSDQSLICIGNQYGGKSPVEIMYERMMGTMGASAAMNSAWPSSKSSHGTGLEVGVLGIESHES